jgi:hypothetical protein
MAKNIDREIQRVLREEMRLEESLNPVRSGALVKGERDVRKVLDKWARKSGLDTKALEALSADRHREIRRGAEKLRRLASKQGAVLHKGNVAQARTLRAMASLATGPIPGGPSVIVLDQARRIATFPNRDVLTASRNDPGDNFAKIRVDRENRGRDRLSFVFAWENTSSEPVIVDASATLSATGFLDLHVNNGLIGNPGVLDVSTRMSARRFLIPFAATSGPQAIRAIIAFNYLFAPAEDASGPAIGAVDHNVRGVLLAGDETLMINVSMTVFSDFDDGHGVADFDSGLLGVGVPQVTLMISQTPNVFVTKG